MRKVYWRCCINTALAGKACIMKKKVLHVINSLMPGGAEMLLVNSLAEGGLQEHTDNIVVYFQGASPLAEKMDKSVQVICLDYKGILSLPATLSKLRKIIREHKIDIVHTHLNPAGTYTHLICPATVPHVHTLHTTYSMDTETRPVMRWLERKLYFNKKDCNVILLSDFTREDFLKAIPFKGRTFVLNNFVPDIFFKNEVNVNKPIHSSLKLIAVGTLKPLKNFEYLLDVFDHLRGEEIYLDIYGGGDRSPYEKIINEKGLKIKMMGYNDDLESVLPDYDLFIMPSKFEGFPLVLFEAMASGVPVMLSNIAPLKSIVGEHAIYFELDNAVATAESIRQWLQMKADISLMAQKAKRYAQSTVRRETYITELLSIYGQLGL